MPHGNASAFGIPALLDFMQVAWTLALHCIPLVSRHRAATFSVQPKAQKKSQLLVLKKYHQGLTFSPVII
jgi:hypothetical protein